MLALGPEAEFGPIPFEHCPPGQLIAPLEHKKLLDLGSLELLISEPVKFRQILDELIQNNRKDCHTLYRLLEERDTDRLSKRAHRIKGAARVVKGELLVECCHRLEAVCRNPQPIDQSEKGTKFLLYKRDRLPLSWHYGAKPTHSDTKKALAINAKCLICNACLVEPGGFEPPSASTPLSVLHA